MYEVILKKKIEPILKYAYFMNVHESISVILPPETFVPVQQVTGHVKGFSLESFRQVDIFSCVAMFLAYAVAKVGLELIQ